MNARDVKNAERVMTHASVDQRGVEFTFADGRIGLVPFSDIPEIGELENLADIDLPNPYEVTLRSRAGEVVELPWDFVRHYCDEGYRARSEMEAKRGREVLGSRVRQARVKANMTQADLASASEVGRVTLARIERGDQSPRYDTLLSIARGLGCPVEDLLSASQ